MMKYLLPISLLLILNVTVKAQILSDTSIAYSQIKRFYFEGLKDTSGFPMPLVSQRNIIDSSEMQFGVFIFQIYSSNDKPRLYLRDFGSNKIEIIKQYNLEPLFTRLFRYFEINNSMISYPQKLQCISKVIELLNLRIR